MRNKKLLIILALLIVAGGAGAIWYLTRPTLDSTFAEAETARKAAEAKKSTAAKPEDVAPDFKKVIELYDKVGVFGKNDKHAESLYRTGKIQQDELADKDAALKTYDQLAKDYPADEPRSGDALLRSAKILREQAQSAPATAKPTEITQKFNDAIGKLEGYRKAFPAGEKAEQTLMDSGEIKLVDMKEPGEAIKFYEQLIHDFPKSTFKPEAMYHIAEALLAEGKRDEALRVFSQLCEEFPKDPKWGVKAQLEIAKMLKENFDREQSEIAARKAAEAAEAARKAAEEAKDPEARAEAEKIAKEITEATAGSAAGSSAQGRYGSIPVDTGFGQPPWKELQKFAEQKLNAKLYTMTVDFLPADHRITVSGKLDLTNDGDDKNTQVLFMLGHEFEIKKITIDGVEATYDHLRDELKVALAKPIASKQAFTLGFEYTAQFADPIPYTPAPDDEKATAEKPLDKPEDIKKLMKETAAEGKPGEPHFNLQIALGNEGFALSGAGWYPITCLGDLFDAKVTYHLPPASNLQLAATGNEDASPRSGGKPGEFVYSTRRDVFGIYFVYGTFDVKEQTIGTVKYVTYLKPANASKSSAYIETAARILNFYGGKFVTFPYEKMAIVETPLPPILGGVGPSSMMMLAEKMVAEKDPPEWLLAHELAHQWFGNLVPINIADKGYSQWLSEGFATYCDAMYTENREGHDKFLQQILRYRNTYFTTVGISMRETFHVRDCPQSTALYRPVVYEKGALVLHALRKVMGDDKFFALMKRYVETFKDKPSVVDDFTKLAAEVYGQPLDWFFKEWLDSSLFAYWTFDSVTAVPGEKEKTYKVAIKISQKAGLIRMPVDITLIGDAKEKKIFPNIEIKDKEQTFDFVSDFVPTQVVLDQDNWTLHAPGSSNVWSGKAIAATMPAPLPSTVPATAPSTIPATAPTSQTQPVETAPAPK